MFVSLTLVFLKSEATTLLLFVFLNSKLSPKSDEASGISCISVREAFSKSISMLKSEFASVLH